MGRTDADTCGGITMRRRSRFKSWPHWLAGERQHHQMSIQLDGKRNHAATRPKTRRIRVIIANSFAITLSLSLTMLAGVPLRLVTGQQHQTSPLEQLAPFPGVTRDLAPFCSSRPSLPIDLAPMIVHVKRNTSFNYKLYLFSDEHVFQTGQIVPRDDFRIHSFPVKLKRLDDFWPQLSVATFVKLSPDELDQPTRAGSGSTNHTSSANSSARSAEPSSTSTPIKRVASSSFNLKRFLSLVPLDPLADEASASNRLSAANQAPPTSLSEQRPRAATRQLPADVHGDVLPGDDGYTSDASISHHQVAPAPDHYSARRAASAATGAPNQENLNRHIEFDRDDQVSLVNGGKHSERRLDEAEPSHSQLNPIKESQFLANNKLILPVGSFSSFHTNHTYLVRKDFDQPRPEIVRIRVDAGRFQVTQVVLINATAPARNHSATTGEPLEADAAGPDATPAELDHPDDYNFLRHKLLRDPNTRITSISQIYEDWITRNFYTIVYIQRRLEMEPPPREEADESPAGSPGTTTVVSVSMVNDRLVFRGSSMVLLGAEQLDYPVKSSAFITEKNGLHYYLEFLTNGKFYLAAIDWTKRPFKIIDARGFPQLKQTKIQFDNEELLLCPPSVCYAEQPLDELVAYGRLALPMEQQVRASMLQLRPAGQPRPSSGGNWRSRLLDENDGDDNVNWLPLVGRQASLSAPSARHETQHLPANDSIISQQISQLVESIKSSSSHLDVRLHLRDWFWSMPRVKARHQQQPTGSENRLHLSSPKGSAKDATNEPAAASSLDKFRYRFELAHRNDIKVNPDIYGFALAGHEIDASYRIFNELYLISANHLITINYTLANETVTSSAPIGDEFVGLSSTLLDPITGAYYDRNSNQIYFFKGDRYVGFDAATRKPLEDFQLQQVSPSPNQQQPQQQRPLILSLPVVGILGRQHQVDGIYHDLLSDIVYIFTGMKFYTFQASDFKEGAFRAARQPAMHCINEHLLDGCHFDAAYPNPCQAATGRHREEVLDKTELSRGGDAGSGGHGADSKPRHMQNVGKNQTRLAKLQLSDDDSSPANSSDLGASGYSLVGPLSSFSQEQQLKLRSIAARGGGLLDLLVEKTLMGRNSAQAVGPLLANLANNDPTTIRSETITGTSSQERIVLYLLMAMVAITILVTIAMIAVIINWISVKGDCDPSNNHGHSASSNPDYHHSNLGPVAMQQQQQQHRQDGPLRSGSNSLIPNRQSTGYSSPNVAHQGGHHSYQQQQFRLQQHQQYLMNQHQHARQLRQNYNNLMGTSLSNRSSIGDQLPSPPPIPVTGSVFTAPQGAQLKAGLSRQRATSKALTQSSLTAKVDSSAL